MYNVMYTKPTTVHAKVSIKSRKKSSMFAFKKKQTLSRTYVPTHVYRMFVY